VEDPGAISFRQAMPGSAAGAFGAPALSRETIAFPQYTESIPPLSQEMFELEVIVECH